MEPWECVEMLSGEGSLQREKIVFYFHTKVFPQDGEPAVSTHSRTGVTLCMVQSPIWPPQFFLLCAICIYLEKGGGYAEQALEDKHKRLTACTGITSLISRPPPNRFCISLLVFVRDSVNVRWIWQVSLESRAPANVDAGETKRSGSAGSRAANN